MAAQRLECELVTEPDLAKMIAAEFGDSIRIPDLGWRPLTVRFWPPSILQILIVSVLEDFRQQPCALVEILGGY
jgi:hypothetical protein